MAVNASFLTSESRFLEAPPQPQPAAKLAIPSASETTAPDRNIGGPGRLHRMIAGHTRRPLVLVPSAREAPLVITGHATESPLRAFIFEKSSLTGLVFDFDRIFDVALALSLLPATATSVIVSLQTVSEVELRRVGDHSHWGRLRASFVCRRRLKIGVNSVTAG